MSATLPAGEYGVGKTLARAGVRRPSSLDYVRLNEWRRLVDAGAAPMAAFVTVATHESYGFDDLRGSASLSPARASMMFRRFAARMAQPEWDNARSQAALRLTASVPEAADTVAGLVTKQIDADAEGAARINLAASKLVLESAGLVGGGKGSTTVNVAAIAQSSSGPSAHDLAATIASDPEASRLYRELLDRMEAAAAKRVDQG